jgi:hypothetical protein
MKEMFSDLKYNQDDCLSENFFARLYVDPLGYRYSKITFGDLMEMTSRSRNNPHTRHTLFGSETCWIILRRRNRIRQAVSLAYADSSKIYHYYGDSEQSDDQNSIVTNENIFENLQRIKFSDDYLDNLRNFLTCHFTLFYEDYIGKELETIKKLYKVLILRLT